MSGHVLLDYCNQLTRVNFGWAHTFSLGIGNFSMYAINHWLHSNTGMAYRPHGTISGDWSADYVALEALAADGTHACIM